MKANLLQEDSFDLMCGACAPCLLRNKRIKGVKKLRNKCYTCAGWDTSKMCGHNCKIGNMRFFCSKVRSNFVHSRATRQLRKRKTKTVFKCGLHTYDTEIDFDRSELPRQQQCKRCGLFRILECGLCGECLCLDKHHTEWCSDHHCISCGSAFYSTDGGYIAATTKDIDARTYFDNTARYGRMKYVHVKCAKHITLSKKCLDYKKNDVLR